MTETGASVHASAVKVGDRAVLIRGPSGAGKSRLAFDLILSGRSGQLPPTVLVGLIEVRGLGIRQCDHVEQAVVGLIVDLAATDTARLPNSEALQTSILGVIIPRIPVASAYSPLPIVIAALTTTESSPSVNLSADCVKGISNHILPIIAPE
jgi:HPr kinase/phosphorylase